MTTIHKAAPEALLIILAATFLAPALPAYSQDVQAGTIQMTTVVANVDNGVDAKKAKAGDAFSAKTVSGTTLNDGTVVPAGSVLEGHVDSVTPSEHKSDSTLVLTIDKLQLKGGKEIPVKVTLVNVATFETEMGGGSGRPQDRAFDTRPGDSARMNGVSDNQASPSGPHAVPGLTLTGTVSDPNSGTLTQAKGNVRLSNENQIQVSVAVVPSGTNVR
jgi:hypothetical protein